MRLLATVHCLLLKTITRCMTLSWQACHWQWSVEFNSWRVRMDCIMQSQNWNWEERLAWTRNHDNEGLTHCCLYQNIGRPWRVSHLFLTCVLHCSCDEFYVVNLAISIYISLQFWANKYKFENPKRKYIEMTKGMLTTSINFFTWASISFEPSLCNPTFSYS